MCHPPSVLVIFTYPRSLEHSDDPSPELLEMSESMRKPVISGVPDPEPLVPDRQSQGTSGNLQRRRFPGQRGEPANWAALKGSNAVPNSSANFSTAMTLDLGSALRPRRTGRASTALLGDPGGLAAR